MSFGGQYLVIGRMIAFSDINSTEEHRSLLANRMGGEVLPDLYETFNLVRDPSLNDNLLNMRLLVELR
jgi:hypothetical protein